MTARLVAFFERGLIIYHFFLNFAMLTPFNPNFFPKTLTSTNAASHYVRHKCRMGPLRLLYFCLSVSLSYSHFPSFPFFLSLSLSFSFFSFTSSPSLSLSLCHCCMSVCLSVSRSFSVSLSFFSLIDTMVQSWPGPSPIIQSLRGRKLTITFEPEF